MSANTEVTQNTDPAQATKAEAGSSPTACCVFVIRVKGQLSDLWADWFEGLTIEHCNDEETVLWGPVVDQSALMGVLNKLSRLNLPLISVNEISEIKKETK